MDAIWAVLPFFGSIRASTLLTALVVAGVILWRRRSPLVALAAVLAWASSFEVIYNGIGSAIFGWPLGTFWWGTAAVFGWVVLAAALGVWPDWRLLLLFAALMLVWIATGYHANVPGSGQPFNVGNEILNETAKTTLAAAYLVGALRSRSSEQEELMKTLVDRDGRTGVGSRLHLHRVAAWCDRALRHGEVPNEAVAGQAAGEEG